MKKNVILAVCASGVLFLSACSTTNSAPTDGSVPPQANTTAPTDGQQQQRPMMNQQNMQQFADEANAAPDKTTLTKDQFTTEIKTLMDAQRAKFQQSGSGRYMNGMNRGSGSMMRGGMRTQSGASMQDRLASAVIFEKYTDPSGSEVLLALDADGKVLMKWPRAFGNRGGMGGGQGPMGGGMPPAGQGQPQ